MNKASRKEWDGMSWKERISYMKEYESVPSIAALSKVLGIGRSTLFRWSSGENTPGSYYAGILKDRYTSDIAYTGPIPRAALYQGSTEHAPTANGSSERATNLIAVASECIRLMRMVKDIAAAPVLACMKCNYDSNPQEACVSITTPNDPRILIICVICYAEGSMVARLQMTYGGLREQAFAYCLTLGAIPALTDRINKYIKLKLKQNNKTI